MPRWRSGILFVAMNLMRNPLVQDVDPYPSMRNMHVYSTYASLKLTYWVIDIATYKVAWNMSVCYIYVFIANWRGYIYVFIATIFHWAHSCRKSLYEKKRSPTMEMHPALQELDDSASVVFVGHLGWNLPTVATVVLKHADFSTHFFTDVTSALKKGSFIVQTTVGPHSLCTVQNFS